MFTTKTTPVTVYQSTDKGAPQLSVNAGSLKTLLKACLITGYGDKKALGWDIPFEDANSAVFRSNDPTSNRYFLKADNSEAKFAILGAYKEMTDLTNGDGYFAYNINFRKFGYVDERTPKWWLIGHGKAFVFIVTQWDNHSQTFYFGDVPSLVAGDTGNTIYLATNSTYDYLTSSINSPEYVHNSYGNTTVWAKKWNQTKDTSDGCLQSASWIEYSKKPEYPDRVTGGFIASETYINEKDNDKYYIRGLLAGILTVQNDFRSIPEGQVFTLDGESNRYMKFSFDSDGRYGYLINITQWAV